MGNNNKRRNKGGNNRPQQYTGKNKDPMGDVGRMEHHAVEVFRDMCRGRYNLENLFEFQNRDFVYAAIKAAEHEFRMNDIIRQALDYTYGMSDGVDVIAQKNYFQSRCNGWQYIVNTMYAFMQTQDMGMLVGMANMLASNRNLRL